MPNSVFTTVPLFPLALPSMSLATEDAAPGAFQLNTSTTSAHDTPAVPFNADGDFLMVWAGERSAGGEIENLSIQRQQIRTKDKSHENVNSMNNLHKNFSALESIRGESI